MAKLHELLAVDRDLEQRAQKILAETIKVFKDKPALFLGGHKVLEMFDEGRQQEEAAAETHQELTTTVPEKLQYASSVLIKYIDALAQKERTNQDAKADVKVEGKVLLADVPATLLLALESRLVAWRTMFDAIPTLQSGYKWVPDPDLGGNIFRVEPEKITNKTEKSIQHEVIVPATERHPAQVHQYSVEKPIGKYKETVYSGMITPARKSEMLGRVDTLIAAVKKARARANQAEIVVTDIGKTLWDFICK